MRKFRSDQDENPAVFDLERRGLQVDTDRRTFGLAGAQVEATVVLGAFDNVAHHQPVGKVNLRMRAEPVGGEEPSVLVMADGEGAAGMVEAHHVVCGSAAGQLPLGEKVARKVWIPFGSITPANMGKQVKAN